MTAEVEYDGWWCTALEVCAVCGHQQVSVYPIIALQLECSRCGYMNEAPELDEEAEEIRRQWLAIADLME